MSVHVTFETTANIYTILSPVTLLVLDDQSKAGYFQGQATYFMVHYSNIVEQGTGNTFSCSHCFPA